MPILLLLLLAITHPVLATQDACNAPSADPIVRLTVPGNPFLALPSADGCWVFVSLVRTAETPARIALLKRASGSLSLARELEVPTNATGMELAQNGALLVVAAGPGVAFVDTAKLTSGADGALIGVWQDDVKGAGRVYANVTRNGRYLFVSDESVQAITVLDIVGVRKAGIAGVKAIGRIPTGRAPIALTFSADERYLFTTSQVTPQANAPSDCEIPNAKPGAPSTRPQGAILVVDVAKAVVDPASSVVATVPAGCSPVRLVTSPKGDIAYVSARASNALLAFDTKKLVDDPANARLGSVPAGIAPVGVAVVDAGTRIVVTSSNRFAGDADDQQVLTVIDAAKMAEGAAAVIGTVPAGAFPRELRTTRDGRTLLLTNFASQSVQMMDVSRLPAGSRQLLLNPDHPVFAARAPERAVVRLDTSRGAIDIEVVRAWSPHGADRFIALVKHGYYDGARFFRIRPGRWAQFGINGGPAIARAWRNRTIPDDPFVQSNVRGTVAFAFAVPNGRATQVFINLTDNSATHDKEPFTPFGRVITGMDIVDALNAEYGEGPGGIRAGKQDAFFEGGQEWLLRQFPRLDYITRATVLKSGGG